MRFGLVGEEFRKLSKNPHTYLAYCGLRRALRMAGHPLRGGSIGFVVFVMPPGYRTYEYEIAAGHLIGADRDDWVETRAKVRLANPPRKKSVPHEAVTVFDLRGLDILIAQNVSDVPKDVRFAASMVMFVEPPSADHIKAARRVSGRSPITDEHALLLAAKPQNIVLAAVIKKDLGADAIAVLDELDQVDIEGPGLFELPGYEEARPWAKGLVADVQRWRGRKLAWKEVSKGALISGPPGTGKTFFASALAKSLGLRLILTTVGTWQSAGHLNDMLAAMRKSFEDASDARGAILFIDEFDSIGMRTSKPTGDSNHHYWQVVVSEFLSLLSNLGEGIIVIGATNHPDWIDPAVLRAGRIEQHFNVPLPDKRTRAAILSFHAEGNLPAEFLSEIAEELDGKSGADLEEMMRKARKSARDEDREIDLEDLRSLLPEKTPYTQEQMFRLAVHEAGHALISLSVGYASHATIEIKDSFDPLASGYSAGLTSYQLMEDHLPTETTLRNRIAVALAGMAAEAAVFGDRSIGSGGIIGSDLERATSLARRMVGSYGFGSTPIFIGTVDGLKEKALPDHLEMEVVEIIKSEYDRVMKMLIEARDRVAALAAEAVAHRSLLIERGGLANAA